MSRRYNAQGSRFDLAARIHVAIRPTFIGLTAIALFGLSTPSAAQSAAPSESPTAEAPSAVPKERTAPRPAESRPTRAIRQPMAAQNGPRPAAAPPPSAPQPTAAPVSAGAAQPAAAPISASATQPAAAPSPQIATQPAAAPQTSSAQPAPAGNGTTFQVQQQLQAAGVKTCLPSADGIARFEMAGVTEYAAASTWNKIAPDQRLVSAVIGQRFGQSVAAPVGVSGVVSAPNANGKCDSVAIQVIPTANACASVQTEVLAKGELLGTLAGVPMFRDKQNMHVMLLPTSGNGCVIVALNNFYAE